MLTAVAALIRWPRFADFWINPDEGIYYSAATWPTWADLWAEVAGNAHPPTFFLLVDGVSAPSLDFDVLRLPALLFGVLAIPAF